MAKMTSDGNALSKFIVLIRLEEKFNVCLIVLLRLRRLVLPRSPDAWNWRHLMNRTSNPITYSEIQIQVYTIFSDCDDLLGVGKYGNNVRSKREMSFEIREYCIDLKKIYVPKPIMQNRTCYHDCEVAISIEMKLKYCYYRKSIDFSLLESILTIHNMHLKVDML